MSHFTVLVPAKDEKELHALLIPYYELGTSRKEDEEVKPYLVFKDMREECQKEYETATVEKVVMSDGRLLSPHDNKFKVPGKNLWDRKYKVPEELERREVPLTELYPTLKAFIEDYHEYDYNEELKTWGYWHNPNKKWDWYSVGGRWSGLLQLKPIRIDSIRFYPSETGNGVGGVNNKANSDPSKCDWADAGYVDWEGMSGKDKRALTYACIDLEGKWHGSGKMGWWGMDSNHDDSYDEQWWDFVESLPSDQRVYVVDCHI